MPNKTIYVSDGDLPVYQRAQELAGGNLSSAITTALRRFVDVEEGRLEGFKEIVVRVGPKGDRKKRFTGRLLGEWGNSTNSRMEMYRVYGTRSGKFVLHVEKSPEWAGRDADGNPAAGLPQLARPGQLQLDVLLGRIDPRDLRFGRADARQDPSPALRHRRRNGQRAHGRRPRHLARAPDPIRAP